MALIRVQTNSRLHFGLLRLPPTSDWRDDGTNYFGGIGLMIAEPTVAVVVENARSWSAVGSASARALSAGQRFVRALGRSEQFAICVEQCPPEHVGLGVGTQLELAVATAIAELLGRPMCHADMARWLGRGRRSGIGVQGFMTGGFLIDEGKRRPQDVSQVHRRDFPRHWPILLLKPLADGCWHGERETAAFASLQPRSSERMNELLHCRIEPAVASGDLRAFGDALTEYNALAGEPFRAWQLGRYADPFVADAVSWLRNLGAAAAGQSSWGPTVFSIWDDFEKLSQCELMAATRWSGRMQVQWTSAANHGALIAKI